MSGRKVAFVGLGGMGLGMALCLQQNGFQLTVHNRTAAKAAPAAEAGATVAATAAEAATGADVVVLSLADEKAVESVLFGQVVPVLGEGAIVVDTSTVSPRYAADAAARLAARRIRRVEACVIGNPPMARAGRLRVLTAGPAADAEAVRDLLDAIGQEVTHVGLPGTATAIKLAFNLVLGNQVAALAEAVSFAEGAGVDRDHFITALTSSGFSSQTLAFRAEMVKARRYAPAQFRTTLMEKDLRLVVQAAAAQGQNLPVTRRAAERYGEVIAAGDGDKDASILADFNTLPV